MEDSISKIQNINLDKATFYNKVASMHQDSLDILEQFKEDFDDICIKLNEVEITHYIHLLEFILKNNENYLERILLLCNKSMISHVHRALRDQLNIRNDIHILLEPNIKPGIKITLTKIIKQLYITTFYRIVKIDQNSDIIFKKVMKAEIIIDIGNSEPIFVVFRPK